MTTRRSVLKGLGCCAATLSLTGPGSAVASTQSGSLGQSVKSFQDELEDRGFTEYESLQDSGSSPDEEGEYNTRVYHKKEVTEQIREESEGEVERPGAVFFEQELTGDWEGSWEIDASLGEVSNETDYELSNTNNVDMSLFKINVPILSPKLDADYTKKNTTIENQTVEGGSSESESLVPPHAIGHIVSSYESLLLELGCDDLRYSDGLWQDMRAGKNWGKTFVAQDEEIDYSKSGVAMAHRTYNAEWDGAEKSLTEGVDGDIYNSHIDIRGYLSIESQGGEQHLAVGGFYINEDEVDFSTGPLSSPEVEVDGESLHEDLIQLMCSRELSE
ncbi:hypothetical protein ACFR9U_14630 [Halorientalis brevis]|uniref:Tat (Twin-arginine translocation) pathway signal sequence n=1 Tax=Halorientalis brevis TaxID=1126241 RepID=A0ABD6CDF1_9EURY|nr:hypothetical protein [Halorientalis brevis]